MKIWKIGWHLLSKCRRGTTRLISDYDSLTGTGIRGKPAALTGALRCPRVVSSEWVGLDNDKVKST